MLISLSTTSQGALFEELVSYFKTFHTITCLVKVHEQNSIVKIMLNYAIKLFHIWRCRIIQYRLNWITNWEFINNTFGKNVLCDLPVAHNSLYYLKFEYLFNNKNLKFYCTRYSESVIHCQNLQYLNLIRIFRQQRIVNDRRRNEKPRSLHTSTNIICLCETRYSRWTKNIKSQTFLKSGNLKNFVNVQIKFTDVSILLVELNYAAHTRRWGEKTNTLFMNWI